MYNVIQYHNVSFYAEKNTYFICGQNIGWRIYQQGLVTLPKQIRGKGPRVYGTMSSGLIHMYLYCKVGIVHNYPPKGRWIHTVVVDIYWDTKCQGIYLVLSTDPKVHGLGFSLGIMVMIPEYFHIKLLSCSTALNANPELNAAVNMSNVKWSFSLALKSNFWDLQTLLLESLALLSNLTVCYIHLS